MVFAVASRYHSPGWSSSSNAFSTWVGVTCSLGRPTRFHAWLEIRASRLLVLSQHGCAIVIWVGEIAATGQRGSVQPPSPASYTNSMSLGLRQLSMVGLSVV